MKDALADTEELKKRKEMLLLERDVARLERRKRFELKSGGWTWWWVAPLSLAAALFFVVGLANLSMAAQSVAVMFFSALALNPLGFKLVNRR